MVQCIWLYVRILDDNFEDQPVLTVATGLLLTTVPGTQPLIAISGDLVGGLAPHLIGSRVTALREYADRRIRHWQSFEDVPREVIPEDAVAAVKAVGIAPFYAPALRVVDVHGLTDSTIARNPTMRPESERVVAHERSPPPGYVERRDVNFRPQPLAETARLALARARYAAQVGPGLWMPFDAADHEWVLERFDGHLLHTAEDLDGIRVISDFEKGLDGWQPSGDAVRHIDVLASSYPVDFGSYHSSRGMLAAFHADDGPLATGTARSPEFTAAADDCLGFLIVGGDGVRTGLRLLANGDEEYVWQAEKGAVRGGQPFGSLGFVSYPLAEIADRVLQLELFDYDRGKNGFVALDHVTLMRAEGGQCPGQAVD